MSVILYLHGFLSSPESTKAKITKQWLANHYPDIEYCCPALSSHPDQAQSALNELIKQFQGRAIYVIGSSLGGYWATYLIETEKAAKAVLVNPGVAPQTRFHEFVGKPLKNFYTDDICCLGDRDLEKLIECDFAKPQFPERYWLMVQKEDETLDYRLAVDKYTGSKQLVEEGGSHTFDNYEKWLPEIIQFFGLS